MYRNRNQRDFARLLRNNTTSAEKHLWQFLRAQHFTATSSDDKPRLDHKSSISFASLGN
jgi:very-short-patch-repair endonuclease